MLVKRVWIEPEPEVAFNPYTDSADVLVEMEDGGLWQAHFVTLAHLSAEMTMSLEVAREHKRALAPTAFLAFETPHVITEDLRQDTIEDVVDNLVVLGFFETVFALCGSEGESRKS